MPDVTRQQLPQFLRQFRFAGGKLMRVRLSRAGNGMSAELRLTAMTALRDLGAEPAPVRLSLKLGGVEEFRFQKRPSVGFGRVVDLRVAMFDNLFTVATDDLGLLAGEQPKLFDFRASDCYISGATLSYELIEKPQRS